MPKLVGYFFFLPHVTPKPFKSCSEQLGILEARGLEVVDRGRAEHILRHHSYYRLSAYRFPFQDEVDQFKAGASFEDIWGLYCFDRNLRSLVSEACKRLEVSLRAVWAHDLAAVYGPQAYEHHEYFQDQNLYSKNLRVLDQQLERSEEPFVPHYRDRYGMSRPPVWCAAEVMTFGLLSRFYANLRRGRDKKTISRRYDMASSSFGSLLEHTVYVRNLCAHHCRLWNRRFTITVELPRKHPRELISSLNPQADRKLYNTLLLLARVGDIVEPENDWVLRLLALLDYLPEQRLTDMGFPGDWRNRSFWREHSK